MSAATRIEWTDRTWNPVRGCSRVSPGCDNCYAMGQAHRFSGAGGPYVGLTTIRRDKVDWSGHARFVPSALAEPLSWRKPQRIFVNSMSDLFHHSLSNEEIAAVFGVMAACPQHTFQVLTKRPDRALEWFKWAKKRGEDGARLFPDDALDWRIRQLLNVSARRAGADMNAGSRQNHGGPWPLRNVHIGVSVENQKTADERIPILRSIRAVNDYLRMLLFASVEPLLEQVDMELHLAPTLVTNAGKRLQHPADSAEIPSTGGTWEWGLDWVIVGGESGAGARTFDIQWARNVVHQCRGAAVPCFVKQLGARPVAPVTDADATNYGERLPLSLKDKKGGDPSEWWESLRVREFPVVSP